MASWRRILLPLALLPLVALAGPPAQRTDLVVWGVVLGPDTKGDEAVIREFQKRNPDLNVRVLSMGSGQMDPQKLMTSIVGNVAPDVIMQDRFTISDWASRNAFRPLDDFLARDRDKDPLCPRREQYYPAVWQEASFGGKVYGIPTTADNRALYWNRGLFRQKAAELRAAGLDPERPPRTWSELLAYSKALTEWTPDHMLKIAGYMPNFGNCWMYMYAFQNNASYMSPDGRRCTLDTPESEEALNFILEGYKVIGGYGEARGFESGFLSNENDAFILGKVAMKVDGDWIMNTISRYAPNLDFQVAPPPVPDDRYEHKGRFANEKDPFITWVGGAAMAIPVGARNVEGAWRYIKFATSTEARLINCQAQQKWELRRGRAYIPKQQGSIEANQAIFNRFTPVDPRFAAALKAHIDLMPAGHIRPVTFVGQLLWDEHVRAMENACFGKLSTKQALLEGQAVVQRGLDDFYQHDRYPVLDLRLPAALFGGLALLGAAALVAAYRRRRLGALARNEARWAYLFVSPWVVGFLGLYLGPMLASLVFSFTQYNVLSPARWVGGKNYADLFGANSVTVIKALDNAVYLGVIGVPLSLMTGLAIALLLNAATRGMRVYRTFFYMPAILPTVASAVLWTWVLSADPNRGLLNAGWNATITHWFGTPAPGWINAEQWAKDSLIVMGMWGAGSGMLLWLAGLKGVPSSLYEAASIDGANPRQSFWTITLPQISPIIFFNLVLGVVASMQEFDRVYVMRPADSTVGPADSLLTPVFVLFQNAFSYFNMGFASALAWVIFAIILALTAIQFGFARKWVHYEVEK